MRINNIIADNFASYKHLEFIFDDQGLVLIQGPNGAGKSTICDLIPWALFGKTSKGGLADEVLSWPGDETCKVCITLDLNGKIFQVLRSRGKSNDLMIWEDGGSYRGKDMTDTQKIINQKLGFDYDLYLAGAYYHEFSQTAQFFTTTAKNRRSICEQLVDLTLAKKIKHRTLDEKTSANKELTRLNAQISILTAKVETIRQVQQNESKKAEQWEGDHERAIDRAVNQYEAFEAGRKRIISNKCRACGTVLAQPKEVYDQSENPYFSRLAELEIEDNPYLGPAKDYSEEIRQREEIISGLTKSTEKYSVELSDLELLEVVLNDYRSTSILNTIKNIETSTNSLLMEHFDGELQVLFDVADADKLEVSISKDGNEASFTQLSKGQRGLLKLCFGVSVMEAVQNHHGIKFNQVFFDESLDGLSDAMKLKAVRLFERLTEVYDSVFFVEHSETVKAQVDNKISVSLIDGHSVIEHG